MYFEEPWPTRQVATSTKHLEDGTKLGPLFEDFYITNFIHLKLHVQYFETSLLSNRYSKATFSWQTFWLERFNCIICTVIYIYIQKIIWMLDNMNDL